MKKYFLNIIILFCILFNVKGQDRKICNNSPKISIRKLKKNYNKSDTIDLIIKNSDTCSYKLLIEAEILISKTWYYEDSLTYLINNSIDDKLIPYHDIQPNSFLYKKFLVTKLIKSKTNRIRYRISIFNSIESFEDPIYVYSNSFYNCRIKFLE